MSYKNKLLINLKFKNVFNYFTFQMTTNRLNSVFTPLSIDRFQQPLLQPRECDKRIKRKETNDKRRKLINVPELNDQR